jgi:molybdopterin-binding protein
MKISARNLIKGKVKKLVVNETTAEVTLVLPDGTEIVSVITKTSADRLGLAKGKDAYAVIKATSVMIAVD